MGPSGRDQLIIGAVATATVAVVSYFFVKRRAVLGKSSSARNEGVSKEHVVGDASASEEPASLVTTSQSYQAPHELQYEETYSDRDRHQVGGTDNERSRDNLIDDGQDQTSFIVLDNGEGAVPPDNGNPRKSDRSSDESSYDVIDDEHLGEAVEEGESEDVEESEKDEGGHALDDGSEQKPPEQDTFLNSNETSMVIIEDLDQSSVAKSESSLYASADETVVVENKLEETDKEREEKDDLLDVAEEEDTVSEADSDNEGQASAALDESSSHEEYEVEDRQTVETPVYLDEAEVLAHTSDPFRVSEQSHAETPASQTSSKSDIGQSSKSDPAEVTADVSDVEVAYSDMTEVLTLCQNSPSTVSKENVHTLVELLRKKIPELHSTVLNCVLRVAAFTQNVKTLRDSGCLKIVADQIQEACKNVAEGDADTEMLNSLCQVLTNLTLDPKSQTELEDTVPSLVDLLLSSDKESTKLSVLRPLINFSSQSSFHRHYTRAIQELYTLLDTGSHIARVQSLKVLVNLSLNEEVVPHMLAAKAPASLLELLDVPTSTDLILRTLTMLANIKVAMLKNKITLASLPVEDKAASPETMYAALHGVNNVSTLRSKVFRLTRHNDEDVSHQASKLHQYLQQTNE